MRIAIFARSLTRTPTGRGFYAREMISALRRIGVPAEIDLFAGEDPELPGCRYRRGRGDSWLGDVSRISRGIARDIREAESEVLWSTTHFLPCGVVKTLPTVVSLLDVVWRDHPETVSYGRRMASGWLERSLEQASRILCISEFTRSRLVAHWPKTEGKAGVVPLAANPRLRFRENAAAELEAQLGLKGPYLLNVGTIEPRKNLAVLVEAMRLLPDITLIQCGPVGWRSDGLLSVMKKTGNIRLLGYVDENTLSLLYSAAVAAVFPTLYEGFHLPPLDALSLGTTVLASDIPVHHEILGDAALYFDPRSPSDIVRHVQSLTGDRRRRAGLGVEQAARYSWDNSARGLWELLLNVNPAGRRA